MGPQLRETLFARSFYPPTKHTNEMVNIDHESCKELNRRGNKEGASTVVRQA